MGYLRGNKNKEGAVSSVYEERGIVDMETGEVKRVVRNRVKVCRSRAERYVTLRVTDGVEKLMGLSGLELKLLVLVSMQCVSGMFMRSGCRSRVVPRGGMFNAMYAGYIGCHKGSVCRALKSLESKGVILMMNNGTLMINPDYVLTNGVGNYDGDKREYDRMTSLRQRELGIKLGVGSLMTEKEREFLDGKEGGK